MQRSLKGQATIAMVIDGNPVIIRLDGDNAPITAGNFVDLTVQGFYDGTRFHRVIREPSPFVAQGGDPQSKDPNIPFQQYGIGGYIDPETGERRNIPLEIKPEGASEPLYNQTLPEGVEPELKHTRGAIAMARATELDTASSQFYFALTDLEFLDGNYAVFGEIEAGIDFIDEIAEISTDAPIDQEEFLETASVIESAEVIDIDALVTTGTEDDDTLIGTDINDEILGLDGDDLLIGEDGNDSLFGGRGQDTLEGGEGEDRLRSGGGIDELRGGDGNDTLLGATGDDTLEGNDGRDRLFGGDQDDSLDGGEGPDRLSGGDGDDILIGGEGNDTLFGELGIDRLFGNDGDDDLSSGGENDLVLGGDGNDQLSGGSENDRLFGGNDQDLLLGSNGNDQLDGGEDSDRLFGGEDNDTLNGGENDDLLNGGTGRDRFVFDQDIEFANSTEDRLTSDGGVDTITDFNPGADFINISATDFAVNSDDLLNLGPISSNQFYLIDSSEELSADHRFLYDSTSGSLQYDLDGTVGGVAPLEIAILEGTPDLTPSNIVII